MRELSKIAAGQRGRNGADRHQIGRGDVRVWLFAYCGKDSPLRSAQLYPLTTKPEGFNQNSRQVTVYDPRTEKFTFIDTCFGTQHLNFAEDDANTLWFSNNTQGKNAAVGWVNTKRFWSTGDAAA
jgi:hypothetical protein